ncbi:MAG TPA: pyridoxal phosphate-dependent aminotransferase family protein [Candidatus Acetothermia bacterium]|nr:pyridoxal phosphate-dependent aminotransferase family protein [Candidatus Acetothermia bacterium]
MNLFDKCSRFLDDPAFAVRLGYPASPQVAKEMNLYPFFIPLDEAEGAEIVVNGRRLVMLGSNNYLGLTQHPDVRAAAEAALRRYGTSCTGSRFLNGTLHIHCELERRLAEYLGKEEAVVFSTGYQSNLGVISGLIGRRDIVLCDKENHASIVDGCRLSLGRMVRYQHNDPDDLDRLLRSCPEEAGKLVVTDGVFSMSGEIASLREIAALCREHDARLMVDDAHGIGAVGDGRGTAHWLGAAEQVDLLMGTFSKSLASIGGYIAGDAAPIHWIRHMSRSLIFSASLPAPNVAAALAALEILQREPERVHRVNALADSLREGLRQLEFDVGNSQTPIIPVFIGDALEALKAWKMLFDAGVYVNVAIPPAVPQGQSLLRTSVMSTHTEAQIERVLAAFAALRRPMRERTT